MGGLDGVLDVTGDGDGGGVFEGVGLGVGLGVGVVWVAGGASPGAAACGSDGAGGAASESSAIMTRTTRPAANGIASVLEPKPGRAPVLWADVRYARRSGVR